MPLMWHGSFAEGPLLVILDDSLNCLSIPEAQELVVRKVYLDVLSGILEMPRDVCTVAPASSRHTN